MNQGPGSQSLLPWITANDSPVYLELKVASRGDSKQESAWSDFCIISDDGPLSRLIKAQLVASNSDTFQDVYLQVQKDYPKLSSHHPWSLTNSDIENVWQNSKTFFSSTQQETFLSGFSLSKDGEAFPFRSLLYCGKRKVFFHPVCPVCGGVLGLCKDDLLLEKSGLEKYTTSLNRYLSCPECVEADSPISFYALEKKATEPECVKDWASFVTAVGETTIGENPPESIPCTGCSEHGECYSNLGVVLSRLVPFSFFPFFMFAHSGPLTQASDFVQKVSGKYEGGVHSSSSFLFKEQPNHAFEVLYLKLVFLHQLSSMILGEESQCSHPDLHLSIEQIWVEQTDRQSLLPELWNFRLVPLEIGFPTNDELSIPITPKGLTLYTLGLTWLTVLAENNHQEKRDILNAVHAVYGQDASEEESTNDLLGELCESAAFKSENIFWKPEENTIPPSFEPYWHQTLSLGLAMLEAGLKGGEESWKALDFTGQVDKLAKAIKTQLFTSIEVTPQNEEIVSQKETEEELSRENDQAIATILDNIALRHAAPSEESSPETEIADTVDEEEATVIMSADSFTLESEQDTVTPVAQEAVAEEEATVIIGQEGLSELEPETPVVSEPATMEDEEATVIMRAGQTLQSFEEPPQAAPAAPAPVTPSQESDDEDLEETVIMDSSALQDLLNKKK